jgi:hypothetical protein
VHPRGQMIARSQGNRGVAPASRSASRDCSVASVAAESEASSGEAASPGKPSSIRLRSSIFFLYEALGVTLGLSTEIRVGEHAYDLGLIDALPGWGSIFLFAGILFVVTGAVAALSYYLVELPFLRRKEGSFLSWRRQRATRQAAEQRT